MGWLKAFFRSLAIAVRNQKGRASARSMGRVIDQFMTVRFGHISDDYLSKLVRNLDQALLSADQSPSLIARAHFRVFRQNVAETRTRIRAELLEHLKDWILLFDSLGIAEGVEKIVDQRLDTFSLDMTTKGLALLKERAGEIVSADTSGAHFLKKLPASLKGYRRL